RNKDTKQIEPVKVEKRLFNVEEEFARVLLQSTRESNILNHVLRQAFDGKTLENLTKVNPLRAEDPHVCNIGHITPEELGKRLKDIDAESGFGNRWLWASVYSDKFLANAPAVPAAPFEELAPVVRLIGNCLKGAILLDAKAVGLWEENYY